MFSSTSDNEIRLPAVVRSISPIRYPQYKIYHCGNFCVSLRLKELRVLAKKILREFWEKYPDTEEQLKSWFQEAEKNDWPNPNFVKDEFPNSRLIPNNRIIFNIKGNQYRLVVRVNYKYQMVYVRFIGTHIEYDKIDPTKI